MIYIVVPVFNRLNKTKLFIESMRKQLYSNYKIVLVDDGSSDGTSEYIKENFPEVAIQKGDGNLFWGGGINCGLDYVRQHATNADVIAFANNDVEVYENTITELLDAYSRNPHALYHSMVIDNDGICLGGGGKVKSWALFRTQYMYRGFVYEKIKNKPLYEIDLASARFLMFSASLLNDVPGIDTDNFVQYGGDNDFSLTCKEKGYMTFVVPSSVCKLDVSTTGASYLNIKSFSEFLHSLRSDKSANCLKLKYKLGKKHCPVSVYPFYCVSVTIKTFLINWKSLFRYA